MALDTIISLLIGSLLALFTVYLLWRKYSNVVPVLSGRVLVDGVSLPNYTVQIDSDNLKIQKVVTDGTFRIFDVPLGDFVLRVDWGDSTKHSVTVACRQETLFAYVDIDIPLKVGRLELTQQNEGKRLLEWSRPKPPVLESGGVTTSRERVFITYKFDVFVGRKGDTEPAHHEMVTSDTESDQPSIEVQRVNETTYRVESRVLGFEGAFRKREITR